MPKGVGYGPKQKNARRIKKKGKDFFVKELPSTSKGKPGGTRTRAKDLVGKHQKVIDSAVKLLRGSK